jgi:hypothetical protein
MPRPISIFLLTLILFGMMHVSCQVRAQSPKEITNSIGMKMVLIPKGTFDMGSAATDRGADLDEPQHHAWIGRKAKGTGQACEKPWENPGFYSGEDRTRTF